MKKKKRKELRHEKAVKETKREEKEYLKCKGKRRIRKTRGEERKKGNMRRT